MKQQTTTTKFENPNQINDQTCKSLLFASSLSLKSFYFILLLINKHLSYKNGRKRLN